AVSGNAQPDSAGTNHRAARRRTPLHDRLREEANRVHRRPRRPQESHDTQRQKIPPRRLTNGRTRSPHRPGTGTNVRGRAIVAFAVTVVLYQSEFGAGTDDAMTAPAPAAVVHRLLHYTWRQI